MTTAERVAILAGFVMGRGGFGLDGSRYWLYFLSLDYETAAEAIDLWGGFISERRTQDGKPQFKYTAPASEVPEILEEMAPYLLGYKRERASELLAIPA
jgi:hypothetical protein